MDFKYISIDESKMDSVIEAQDMSVWSWASSIQALLQYNGFVISQDQIVEFDLKTEVNLETESKLKNETKLKSNTVSKTILTGVKNKTFSIEFKKTPGPPSPDTLIKELHENRPILFEYVSFRDSEDHVLASHGLIITAVNYTQTNQESTIHELMYRDTFPTQDFEKVKGRRSALPTTFVDNILCYWVINVEASNF